MKWEPIVTAPRDGTVIEIQNDWGIAPTFGLSKWVSKRGWVDATDEDMGTMDGEHLTWRPFDGDPSCYVDPTNGAQYTQEYWRNAGSPAPHPHQTRPWWERLFDIGTN